MSDRFERAIVVGVGRAAESLAAVDHAAAEASRRKLPLLLLSVHPNTGAGGPDLSLTAVLRVHASWPELAATAENVTGDPARALIDASRSAALMVVGREAAADTRLPGSVYAHVVAHAHCPTLVVPAGAATAAGDPVLLGLGMSPEDEATIGFAFEEAALRGVPLLAVHVWSGMPANALGAISPFAYDLNQARAASDRMLAEVLAGWADKYPDVAVERMPLYDVNPARTLLEAGALAGLVVVGARRNGRRSSQLLGTVTRTLLTHAVRPVAVVRL